jgi:uncharacterized protein YbjT (DUF2867 family)
VRVAPVELVRIRSERRSPWTIAVITPTGNVGSHVVQMLCQAGAHPRLLRRNPDCLDAEVHDQVELAVGDQRDAGYVAGATRGVEAVLWVHPDDFSLPDPDAALTVR